MSRILPRYTRHTQAKHDKQTLDRILKDTPDEPNTTDRGYRPTPADTQRLRGIPVAGATTGTTPGTDPLRALLAKQPRP